MTGTKQATKTTTKMVAYAYPTSNHAVRAGYGRTGCYVVELWDRVKPPRMVAAYLDRPSAVASARQRPEPWDSLHLRYHPEDEE